MVQISHFQSQCTGLLFNFATNRDSLLLTTLRYVIKRVTIVSPNPESHLNKRDKHPRIKQMASGRGQLCTPHHQGTNPTTNPDLLSCGRGQQTVPFSTKPQFGRKQSKSFGIRRGQISLQFKYISKKFPYMYLFYYSSAIYIH